MNIPMHPGEIAIHSGGADLQRGAETVGGRLLLTDRRLVFVAHSVNIQTGITELPLHTIAAIRPVWTRFLNVFPIVPNSLSVELTDGSAHRFVLYRRSAWKRDIDQARGTGPAR